MDAESETAKGLAEARIILKSAESSIARSCLERAISTLEGRIARSHKQEQPKLVEKVGTLRDCQVKQTEDSLELNCELQSTSVSVKFSQRLLTVEETTGQVIYRTEIPLFARILPSESSWKREGTRLFITLKKGVKYHWRQLREADLGEDDEDEVDIQDKALDRKIMETLHSLEPIFGDKADAL
uniref:CS domain-containing protein n=1 Tax=Palpitomonas bilix TaxID=652834 RepID=A0A7S3D7N6_9EUKA|mmetsp:Transcript_25896/g.65604  ORF Transcript_25896/g.65604 Transcript_25896/m.65604 type:complete len:184 (+) Transcript_25896:613-1164(+)